MSGGYTKNTIGQSWAPAGIFPGGGANLWGGAQKKSVKREGGPPYFF